jgi:hypothetical protein
LIRYRCDGCGANLPADGSGRFIVRVEAFAAAGQLEFSEDDLKRDHNTEMQRIIEEAQNTNLDEIEDGVYRSMRFDLCPACHRRYLRDPIAVTRVTT